MVVGLVPLSFLLWLLLTGRDPLGSLGFAVLALLGCSVLSWSFRRIAFEPVVDGRRRGSWTPRVLAALVQISGLGMAVLALVLSGGDIHPLLLVLLGAVFIIWLLLVRCPPGGTA